MNYIPYYIRERISKFFSGNGRCQNCLRYTRLNHKGYCVECWIELKERQGKYICLICGRFIGRDAVGNEGVKRICSKCRKSLVQRLKASPAIEEVRKRIKGRWITDRGEIKRRIIEKLRSEGEMSYTAMERFFPSSGIRIKVGFEVLEELAREGIVSNTRFKSRVGRHEVWRRKYKLVKN